MAWQVIGCSEIGVGHIKNNTPCQDYCDHKILDQVVFGAVSDGMGSAIHSDIGSKIAVEKAIDYLTRNFNNDQDRIDNDQVRIYFKNLLQNVVSELQIKAKKEGCYVRDLACTLLAFVATPKRLLAMQVGDGFIVIRPKSKKTYQLLFQPKKGEYINETVSVISSEASQEMECQIITETIEFICAATDGIERMSLEKPKDWKAHDKFFEPLETQIMRSNTNQVDKEDRLRGFLKSEEVNERTDDDKTVLLCIQNASNTINTETQSLSSSQVRPPREPSQSQSPRSRQENSLFLLPFLSKKRIRARPYILAIFVTLICIAIKFLPYPFAILFYFLYNSLIWNWIFDLRRRKRK